MGMGVMILVSGFILLLGSYRINMQNTAVEAVANLSSQYSGMQARFIAESGANIFLNRLKQDPRWRGRKTGIPIADGTVDVTVSDREDLGTDVVEIKSVAAYFGQTDSVSVVLNVLPVSDRFSRFSYFSNREDNIWFYSADTLYGPVHTNGRFNMTGSPVFYGQVSSVSATYNTAGRTDPHFLGGTEFGRSAVELSPDFNDLHDAALNGGHLVLNYPLYLVFNADGTYRYRTGTSGPWETAEIPANGVIACNRDIFIEGTVNGQVTVGTTKNVYITGDIVYADNPALNSESDDLLGLVAYGSVVVRDNSANRDGCTIQAAILARDGSFRAENIYFYPAARLALYGGIVQEKRGAVGRLGSPPTGFEKFYQYDERMEYIFPPHYPIAPGSAGSITRKARISILYWK